MDVGTIVGSLGPFTLAYYPLKPEQQNKVYHISLHHKDYINLPLPFCEIRELPDWNRKIHIMSHPGAQKLTEIFHRYGPKVKTTDRKCPFGDGEIKKRFESLVGGQNLGTTYEGESERYRTALLKFLNTPSNISKFEASWTLIAKQWVANQIQRGEVDLFDAVHHLIAECLLKGILGYDKCTEEDIKFNVSYWKQLFTPMPHQVKSVEELEREGKAGLMQKGFNLFKNGFTSGTTICKTLWTYYISSSSLDDLAEIIHLCTVNNQESLCYFLNENQFTKEEIISFIKGMLLAGQETTGYLLGFALYEYANNLEMQSKHVKHPDSIRNAYLETLRLYSPAGALRKAEEDLIMYYNPQNETSGSSLTQEHYIRKGDLICCVPNISGHKSDYWEQPDKFDCERKNLEKVNDVPHFGSGAHRCLGEKVAKQEIMTLLKTILSQAIFTVKAPLPDLVDNFTLRPVRDIKINFTQRTSDSN